MTLDLTERCGDGRCSHAPGEGRFGGIAAYAATYSRRISSKCQGSVVGGDPLNAIVNARCIVCTVFTTNTWLETIVGDRSFYSAVFHVENGRKRYSTDYYVELYSLGSLI